MSRELINSRAAFLEQFDEYIRENIDDEEIFDYWLEQGVPDGADIDELVEIAKDEELWFDCVIAFAKCCALAGVLE